MLQKYFHHFTRMGIIIFTVIMMCTQAFAYRPFNTEDAGEGCSGDTSMEAAYERIPEPG